jgi:hypothetical protein
LRVIAALTISSALRVEA